MLARVQLAMLTASLLTGADGAEPRPSAQRGAVAEGDGAPPREGEGRGRVRVELAYVGSAYAPQLAWQGGLGLSLAWQSHMGVYAGAGFDALPAFQAALRSEAASLAVSARVTRYPIHALVGYHHQRRRWGIGGELRVISELDRTAVATFPLASPPPRGDGIDAERDLSFLLGFSPRLRLTVNPRPRLGLALGLGVDIFALNRAFLVDFRDPDTGARLGRKDYLRPRVARPTASLGFVFWL